MTTRDRDRRQSPMPSTRQLGCNCKNESDFEACPDAISLPCCEYCRASPSAYVVKVGCTIGCDGIDIWDMIALWRECQFGEDACRYTARYARGVADPSDPAHIPGALSTGTSAAYSTDVDEDGKCIGPLNKSGWFLYGGAGGSASGRWPIFQSLFPPVYQEDAESEVVYKRIPFKGCCKSPSLGFGLFTGPNEGECTRSGWNDYYGMCREDFDGIDDTFGTPEEPSAIAVELTIDSETTASLRFYGSGSRERIVLASYHCPEFDCTGDDNTFVLDEGSYTLEDRERCPGLPCSLCVSRYADNFKTPCLDGQASCDCCDPGYATANFILDAPGCGIDAANVNMSRVIDGEYWYCGDGCPNTGLEALAYCGADSDVGDCGFFTSKYGTGCRDATTNNPLWLVLKEWCVDGEWHLHLWCSDLDTVCTDLGEDTSGPNCSCPTGADPSFSIDLGPCCCVTCTTETDCCDEDTGLTLLADTLYATITTSGGLSPCPSGLNGLVVTMSRTDATCTPFWTGTEPIPGAGCSLTVEADVHDCLLTLRIRVAGVECWMVEEVIYCVPAWGGSSNVVLINNANDCAGCLHPGSGINCGFTIEVTE